MPAVQRQLQTQQQPAPRSDAANDQVAQMLKGQAVPIVVIGHGRYCQINTAAPAPVALVPLTYDQIVDALVDDAGLNLAFRSYEDDMKFARAIERAHGIKAGKDVAK